MEKTISHIQLGLTIKSSMFYVLGDKSALYNKDIITRILNNSTLYPNTYSTLTLKLQFYIYIYNL